MCLSHFCIFLAKWRCEYFLTKPFQYFFNKVKGTISAVAATALTLSFSVVETEVATNTRHWNESIRVSFVVYSVIFVKGGQAAGATEVQVTSFYVQPNPKICLCCVYVVYDNLSTLCMTIFLCCVWKMFHVVYEKFWLLLFVYIVYDIKSDLNFFYII